ncbi:hypothetical protein ACWCQZ_51150 [Streptomyces sp. NPDC002285]
MVEVSQARSGRRAMAFSSSSVTVQPVVKPDRAPHGVQIPQVFVQAMGGARAVDAHQDLRRRGSGDLGQRLAQHPNVVGHRVRAGVARAQ